MIYLRVGNVCEMRPPPQQPPDFYRSRKPITGARGSTGRAKEWERVSEIESGREREWVRERVRAGFDPGFTGTVCKAPEGSLRVNGRTYARIRSYITRFYIVVYTYVFVYTCTAYTSVNYTGRVVYVYNSLWLCLETGNGGGLGLLFTLAISYWNPLAIDVQTTVYSPIRLRVRFTELNLRTKSVFSLVRTSVRTQSVTPIDPSSRRFRFPTCVPK